MRNVLPVAILAMIVLIMPHGYTETVAVGILLVVGAISLARVIRGDG
jgi:hypothetical protein